MVSITEEIGVNNSEGSMIQESQHETRSLKTLAFWLSGWRINCHTPLKALAITLKCLLGCKRPLYQGFAACTGSTLTTA